MSRAALLLAVVGFFGAAPLTRAQEEGERARRSYLSRDLARAAAQARNAEQPRLLEEMRDAARRMYTDRRGEFICRRGTLEFLDEIAWLLLDSELALCSTDRERVAALERHWARVKEVEQENIARYEAGRVDYKDYHGSRYHRMKAELLLAEAGAKLNLPPGFLTTPPRNKLVEALSSRELARAQYGASAPDLHQLRTGMRDAARIAHIGRLRNMYAARGTLDFTLRWSLRWLEAERRLARNDEEFLPALERHWMTLRQLEDLNQARYLAGRVAVQDLAQSREYRLEAEIWLADARARLGDPPARTRALLFLVPEGQWHLEWGGLDPRCFDEIGLFARAAAKGGHRTLGEWRRERLAALREQYDAREKEFEGGRGTLDFLLESALRLVELQRQLATDGPARLAVLEQHWKRTRRIEEVVRFRLEAGRVAPQDYQQCRFHRLQAELWLRQARDVATK